MFNLGNYRKNLMLEVKAKILFVNNLVTSGHSKASFMSFWGILESTATIGLYLLYMCAPLLSSEHFEMKHMYQLQHTTTICTENNGDK